MKKVNLPFNGLLLAALLCSCSPQDSLETLSPNTANGSDNSRLAGIAPDNKLNPQDFAGESYRELLYDYQAGIYNPQSLSAIDAIIDELAGAQVTTIMSLDTTTDELLSNIIQSPKDSFATILQQSWLSQNAKNILSDFIEDFDNLKAKPFEDIYAEIVSLENTISGSNVLTPYDKDVLLTVTSIARYSFSNKCCEDTDWGTSVGNIVAATAGALINTDLAIRYALVTRIAEYEQLPL